MKGTFLGILIALLLVFGVVAPGHAAFTQGDLIRVVYDLGTTTEEATDLGSLSTILSTSGLQTLGSGALADQLGDFGAGQSWSAVNVAYFVYQTATTNTATNPGSYVAVSSTASSVYNYWNGWNGVSGNAVNILNYYSTAAANNNTGSTAVASTSGASSYYQLMDKAGSLSQQYAFGGWLASNNNDTLSQTGETNAGTGSSQNTNLFEWTGSSISGTYARNGYTGLNVSQLGTLIASVQTVEGANGLYTTLTSDEAAPVPVPPSVFLMAPGLLGLLGLRKRMWG